MASDDKWLIVHGRKKWWHFYLPENVEKQRQFFNRFLKGIDNHVKDWPRVTIEVREKYYVGETRTENEWPLARTLYTKYFLDASDGSLWRTAPPQEASVRYNADRIYDFDPANCSPYFLQGLERYGGRLEERAPEDDKPRNAVFEMEFPERTELTGYMNLSRRGSGRRASREPSRRPEVARRLLPTRRRRCAGLLH